MAISKIDTTGISSVANTAISGTINVTQLDIIYANGSGSMAVPAGTRSEEHTSELQSH